MVRAPIAAAEYGTSERCVASSVALTMTGSRRAGASCARSVVGRRMEAAISGENGKFIGARQVLISVKEDVQSG